MGVIWELARCRQRIAELEAALTPPPDPFDTIGINEMSSILLDKLDDMGDTKADIHLPDGFCKVYKKEDIETYLDVDQTDKIVFVAETMDCDDFAAILFGKFAGLVWSNVHGLNWFIDEYGEFWFIEPQTDQLAADLDNWQGWEIRFFIGR